MLKIKRATIESIIRAAENVYPNEFIAMLGGNRKKMLINEIVVLPAVYGRTFGSLQRELIPYERDIFATVHSHPSIYAKPSAGDLHIFKRLGEIHLIIAYPFSFDSIRAFDAAGNALQFEVVE